MNVFSLSFGKDSMATLILAAEQGIPIDRVMYVEVKFNDEISGEHPIMAEWIPTAEKRLKDLFGVTVDHAYCGYTYVDKFFKKKKRGKFMGETNGFPWVGGAWCNDLKRDAIRGYYKQFYEPITEFLGIAIDEPERWGRSLERQTAKRKCRSILVEQNFTEQDAMEICRKYDLLSPLYSYEDTHRGGCWFCPKQCMAYLYHLWKDYPDLYNRLLEMEPYSETTFRPRGGTLAKCAARFESGYIPKRRKKAKKFVQLNMFDKIDGGDSNGENSKENEQ